MKITFFFIFRDFGQNMPDMLVYLECVVAGFDRASSHDQVGVADCFYLEQSAMVAILQYVQEVLTLQKKNI